MTPFPKDDMASKIKFFGDPRGADGVSAKWYSTNVVRVAPPFKMTYAGKPISGISFHKRAADELRRALMTIWDHVDRSQVEIDRLKLSEFGGSFNYRLIRGSSNMSNHSFAIAIDIMPTGNELGKTKGAMPKFAVDAFKAEGFKWGGDYKGRKDWMHFEAVSS